MRSAWLVILSSELEKSAEYNHAIDDPLIASFFFFFFYHLNDWEGGHPIGFFLN